MVRRWVSVAPLLVMAGALAVSVPRLAAVFSAVEPPFLGLKIAWLTGPGYGLASAACAFYAWHVYQQRKALKLARWLVVGWSVLLVLMAAIQVPGILATMHEVTIATLLGQPADIAWAALLAISSELVVAVAALSSALVREPGERRAPPGAQSDAAMQDKNAVMRSERLKCPRCGARAGKNGLPFRNAQQISAHLRWCSGGDDAQQS